MVIKYIKKKWTQLYWFVFGTLQAPINIAMYLGYINDNISCLSGNVNQIYQALFEMRYEMEQHRYQQLNTVQNEVNYEVTQQINAAMAGFEDKVKDAVMSSIEHQGRFTPGKKTDS